MNRDESEQVALAVVEDRRNNTAQFDLAYIDVDGQEILAAFDSCSSTTLIHRELTEEENIKVEKTTDDSKIAGIGGVATGKVVSLILCDREGRQIKINASVVDEIATLKKKDKDKFELLTRESADEVKRIKCYENITKENFQQVPGGKIKMLLGQDIGGDSSLKKYQPINAASKFQNIG